MTRGAHNVARRKVLVKWLISIEDPGTAAVSPLAPTLGFVPLSPAYFGSLLGMVVVHRLIVERAKHWATAKLVVPA